MLFADDLPKKYPSTSLVMSLSPAPLLLPKNMSLDIALAPDSWVYLSLISYDLSSGLPNISSDEIPFLLPNAMSLYLTSSSFSAPLAYDDDLFYTTLKLLALFRELLFDFRSNGSSTSCNLDTYLFFDYIISFYFCLLLSLGSKLLKNSSPSKFTSSFLAFIDLTLLSV